MNDYNLLLGLGFGSIVAILTLAFLYEIINQAFNEELRL